MEIPIVLDAGLPPVGNLTTVNDACPGCGKELAPADVAYVGGALEVDPAAGKQVKRLYAVCTPCWLDPVNRTLQPALKMHFFPRAEAMAYALLMNSKTLHAPGGAR